MGPGQRFLRQHVPGWKNRQEGRVQTISGYDCATGTLYALVLVVPGVTIKTDNDQFIKLGNNNKLVDQDSGDNGVPPDFHFITVGNATIGWEASAKLNNPLSIDDLNVHAQVNDGGSQTSAVD